ncbi:aminodeoxychorismate lyase [Metabacillus fastidiosus]|uniref:aminodeoxychorismate lyase n=1 Tax=Metabacillus fastidiosus TaxID=1458 RepID=UPI003D28477D
MYIYLNSEFIKDTEARISPFDHGFLYGLGVFETFRVYKGFPFLLKDHIERLNQSLEQLNIHYKVDVDEAIKVIDRLLFLNKCENKDATIRLNVSAGNGEVGKLTESYFKPNVMYLLRQAPPNNDIEKNIAILQTRRNTPEGSYRLKSHHYLNNILGKRELIETPELEGVFLTEEGYVSEGIVTNVFWVKKGIVYTPSLDTGILNGITRQFIMRCLSTLGIPVQEGQYTLDEMIHADEIFLTNSTQEILPVKEMGEHLYLGNEGAVVNKLKGMYRHYHSKLLTIEEL